MPSLADGLAGPVEENSITISLACQWVDEFKLVSEEHISHAIIQAWKRWNERIEGSAAAALAAALYGYIDQRPAVVILSGGNIQPETHSKLVGN